MQGIPTYQQYNNGTKFETDKEKIMSLPNYNLDNVEDKGPKTYKPGDYFFEVKNAQEKTSSKGNVYTGLTLSVETSDGDCNVFDNIFYSEAALFKLKGFVEATGIEQPTELEHFIGAQGKAHFVVGERGYLEVKYYINKNKAGESPVEKVQNTFAANTPKVEDLPF